MLETRVAREVGSKLTSTDSVERKAAKEKYIGFIRDWKRCLRANEVLLADMRAGKISKIAERLFGLSEKRDAVQPKRDAVQPADGDEREKVAQHRQQAPQDIKAIRRAAVDDAFRAKAREDRAKASAPPARQCR